MLAPAMSDYTVLGAEGFIGRHLVRHLRAQGLSVRSPARGAPEIHEADLGRVFYCIGLTGDFIDRPLDTVEAHVCALASLLRTARFASLVYLSSTRLYDGLSGLAQETATLRFDPRDRRRIYDLSKATGEALCHAFPDRRLVIARLSSVYDDALSADNFLHGICRKALASPAVEVETAPEEERDYVHVDDVCRALHRLAEAPRERVYNVASGINLSNRALFDVVARATGCRITIRERPAAWPVPRIDVSRLRDELGITPAAPEDRVPALLSAHRRSSETSPG
jgi:nucleoside-diphosphate-sugar epimerase